MCTVANATHSVRCGRHLSTPRRRAVFHVEGRRQESFDDRVCRRLRNAKAIFPPNLTIIGGASVLWWGKPNTSAKADRKTPLMRFTRIPPGHRFGSSYACQAAVNAVAHIVVACHAPLDSIALASKGWFLYLESPLVLNCFHSRFCLGVGVVDPQRGG